MTVHIPHWSPGDCLLRDVQADGVILRCERDVWHERPLPVSGERSIETQTHGSSQMRQGRHRNFFIKDPTAYTVRPDEHEPCDDCNGWPNSFIDATGEAPVPASCYSCDGTGLVHDRWCGCTPPLSMLGVGSQIVDSAGRNWTVVKRDEPAPSLLLHLFPAGATVWLSVTDIAPKEWWVARWVPPTDDAGA